MADATILGQVGLAVTMVSVGGALWFGSRTERARAEEKHAKEKKEAEESARVRTEELKAEIRLHDETVERRLTVIETRSGDFMPRREIENLIEHEKNNRVTADAALKGIADQHSRDISDMRVAIGRIDQKQDGMSGEIGEMKLLLRDMGREINGKLDKQQECLNSLSRRTA